MTKCNDIPIVESNNLIKTDKGSMLKKFSYVVFGILPATFFSILSLLLIGGILSRGAIFIIIFITAALSGTAGLYTITFSEEHNPKIVFLLLIMGQLAMLLIIGFSIASTITYANLSLESFLSYIFTKTYEFVTTVIMFIIFFGPIAVALHYQITVYRPWRLSNSQA